MSRKTFNESLSCFTFLVSLFSCVIASAQEQNSENTSGQTSFNLMDERPANQRTSFSDTDSVGQNLHIGDDRINPGPYDLVKTTLYENLNKSLIGKTVVLTDFLIIITDPAFSLSERDLDMATSSTPGIDPATAGAVIYGIEKLKGRKNVYVRITGKIDDKLFSNQNSENFYFGVSEKNLFKLINKTLADTVTEAKVLVLSNKF